MTDYQCPNCSGGFPVPVKWQGKLVCPWCYEEFLKHHTHPEQSLEMAERSEAA